MYTVVVSSAYKNLRTGMHIQARCWWKVDWRSFSFWTKPLGVRKKNRNTHLLPFRCSPNIGQVKIKKKTALAAWLMPLSKKRNNRLWPNQLRSPPFSNPFQIALLCDRRRSTPDLRLPRKLRCERSSEVWGSHNFCHGLMVLNGI